jgi:hypothetical protein
MPQDLNLVTYVWLAPTSGWGVAHTTYVDRIEAVVIWGDKAGQAAPEPARRVRPNPGAQTDGPGWVWFEGEDAIESNVPPGGVFAPFNVAEQGLLSNGWWMQHHSMKDRTATWEVNVPEAGTYTFWSRGLGSNFDWAWDDGEWRHYVAGFERVNEVKIRDHDVGELSVSWTDLGKVELSAGKHKLRFRGVEPDDAMGFDAWLLTTKPFRPNGADKPPA